MKKVAFTVNYQDPAHTVLQSVARFSQSPAFQARLQPSQSPSPAPSTAPSLVSRNSPGGPSTSARRRVTSATTKNGTPGPRPQLRGTVVAFRAPRRVTASTATAASSPTPMDTTPTFVDSSPASSAGPSGSQHFFRPWTYRLRRSHDRLRTLALLASGMVPIPAPLPTPDLSSPTPGVSTSQFPDLQLRRCSVVLDRMDMVLD